MSPCFVLTANLGLPYSFYCCSCVRPQHNMTHTLTAPVSIHHSGPSGEAAGAINSTALNLNLLKDCTEDTYAAQRVQVRGCGVCMPCVCFRR